MRTLGALLLPLLLLHAGSNVIAQMDQPLKGNGGLPPTVGGPTKVHVSAFMDRLLKVNDVDYTFEALVLVYMSWIDPRAKKQIAETGRDIQAGNYSCEKPCQSTSNVAAGGCCDKVWRPAIMMPNLRGLPSERLNRFGFGVDPHSDVVFTWQAIHGVWFARMDLRAFPFDRQTLPVRMQVIQVANGWSGDSVQLVPSALGDRFSSKGPGDDLSGWLLNNVTFRTYEFPICTSIFAGFVRVSSDEDPAPLVPPVAAKYKAEINADPVRQCMALVEGSDTHSHYMPHPLNPALLAGSPGKVTSSSNLDVEIHVTRMWTPHIVSGIFPIMATTWLAFLVFLLPRKDMDARLGPVVGLFLALAAIQFVVNEDLPASSYITAMQMMMTASYLALIVVGGTCVLVWYLTNYHKSQEHVRKWAASEQALKLRAHTTLEAALQDAMGRWMHERGQDHPDEVEDNGRPQWQQQLLQQHHKQDNGGDAKPGDEGGGRDRAGDGDGSAGTVEEGSAGQWRGPPGGPRGEVGSAAGGARSPHGEGLPARSASAAGSVVKKGAASLRWRHLNRMATYTRLQLHTFRQDPVYADRIAYKVNLWAAASEFIAYNLAVALIFTVCSKLYRVHAYG